MDKCFLHLGVFPRLLNGTTLCSVDSSRRCSPPQEEHKCMSHISQNKGGTGVSQKWHLNTSWALRRGSMIRHLMNFWISWKRNINFYFIANHNEEVNCPFMCIDKTHQLYNMHLWCLLTWQKFWNLLMGLVLARWERGGREQIKINYRWLIVCCRITTIALIKVWYSNEGLI